MHACKLIQLTTHVLSVKARSATDPPATPRGKPNETRPYRHSSPPGYDALQTHLDRASCDGC
eukprot:m.35017 g.35017  ORF g.35017 m.35017 type:complete len:62 (+) comp12360_c0_seq1:31-216(+)